MSPALDLSIVVLTFNETGNLPRLLASIAGLDCPRFAVDSGSADGTQLLVQRAGFHLYEHPFETHTRQWAWALGNLPLNTTWILALDADQYLTDQAAVEMRELFLDSGRLDGVNGLYINRRQVFRGRWIRHGGYYPKRLLKAFRRTAVFFDPDDLVDHHFYVQGPTKQLKYDLVERNDKEDDISFWIAKHIRYARLLAEEELRRRSRPDPLEPALFGSPDQRTLWLKRLWRRLPPLVRPCVYFIYRYVFRLGFLDGKPGFIFHFMQGLWFRLLVDIYLEEYLARRAGESGVIAPGGAAK
jgi:glycosyltransferase involved in cell wall biosynthesis